MANELNVQATIQANKANTMANVLRTVNVQLDIAGTNYEQGTQTYTTTAAALDIGVITTVGFVFIRNTAVPGTGAGNLLIQNGSGGTVVAQVRPGSFALFEAGTNTLFVKTSAGTLIGESLVIEA